jgi:rare lipoprotein A (peptidoglycan hydrolase)
MLYTRKAAISTIVLSHAILGLFVYSTHAQTFEDRWGIVPPANAAEPPPPAAAGSGSNRTSQPQENTAVPGQSEETNTQQPGLANKPAEVLIGRASFYAYRHGKTASGALFDRNQMTAASRTLPLGTRLRVTDLKTNKSVDVTITDRGPASKHVILDLSLGAARALGIGNRGIIDVRAEIIG